MSTVVVNRNVIESDDVEDSDKCPPNPGPKPPTPEPTDKCCDKSYTIVLHFH